MNGVDLLVVLGVLFLVLLAIRLMKKGHSCCSSGGCSGNCSACKGKCSCNK